MDQDRKEFTAGDVKKLAGLSYRQLNDWESRGAIPSERPTEGSWRKFSAKELFAVMICSEIRQRYGIPVEKIRYVHDFMMTEKANHLAAAIRLMEYGLSVYLLTDFAETFMMDSDLDFADLLELGYFRADHPEAFILIRLNDIVNRLLQTLEEPLVLKPHDAFYRIKEEMDAAPTVKTQAELDLLQAVRSRNFDRITITLKDWGISEMSSEGDAESDEIQEADGKVILSSKRSFETFTVSRADGKMVRARRKIPVKYSEKDNRPVLFVYTYDEKSADSKDT